MEVDVAAFNRTHRSLLIGECKWTQHKCDISVLAELNRKADILTQKTGCHVGKMIFSKSGFTPSLRERAKIEQVRLVSLEELFA